MSRRIGRTTASSLVVEENNAPIEVFADNTIIDGGIAAVPKMLLRFARFLTSDGETLNDRQILLTVMVIALHEERNLRLSNLPMTAAISTLDSDLTHLRKVGLVFTQRDYYPAVEGRPPRMRSQIWDIRSLTINLDQVQRLWFARQAKSIAEWKARSQQGRRPVYEFPAAFRHEVVIPRPVMEDIAAGRFFPVPEKWTKLAQSQFTSDEISRFRARYKAGYAVAATEVRGSGGDPTAKNAAGRHGSTAPTASNRVGRQPPTEGITGGHLVTSSLSKEIQPNVVDTEEVFARFAVLKGEPYRPSGRDRKVLNSLRAAGYAQSQITAAIEAIFARGDRPHRFAYCAELVQETSPACPPAASARTTQPVETTSAELVPGLEKLARRIGESQPDTSRRQIQTLVETYHDTAQQTGATGAEWVREALELSLNKAQPLVYAAAVLRNWKTAGREGWAQLGESSAKAAKAPKKPRDNPVPGSHWNESVDA